MSLLETNSITVPYRNRCEDFVQIIEQNQQTIIIVADGAGGSGAGYEAAQSVIRECSNEKTIPHDSNLLCQLIAQIDNRIANGESTCVIASLQDGEIRGASVGDSQAWLIEEGQILNLTSGQIRKPLLGTGRCEPFGFYASNWNGMLILATDGFCNYINRPQLLKDILWLDFQTLPRKLVEMVRLPSGELWDDVGIVVCRKKKIIQRQIKSSRRYST